MRATHYFPNTVIKTRNKGADYNLEVTTSGKVYARVGGAMRKCDVLTMQHIIGITGPDDAEFSLQKIMGRGWVLTIFANGNEIELNQSKDDQNKSGS